MAKRKPEKSETRKLEDLLLSNKEALISANHLLEELEEWGETYLPRADRYPMPEGNSLPEEVKAFSGRVTLRPFMELVEAYGGVLEAIEGIERGEYGNVKQVLSVVLSSLERAAICYEVTVADLYPIYRLGSLHREQTLAPKRKSRQDEFNDWVRGRGGIPKPRTRARQRFMEDAIEHFGVGKRQIERYMGEHRGDKATF